MWWWEVGNEKIWERYVGECENRHLNIIVARWNFLLEARVVKPSSLRAAEAEYCLRLQRTVRQPKLRVSR